MFILSSEYMINSLIPLWPTGINDQFMKLLRELVNGSDLWLWNLAHSLMMTAGKMYLWCFQICVCSLVMEKDIDCIDYLYLKVS